MWGLSSPEGDAASRALPWLRADRYPPRMKPSICVYLWKEDSDYTRVKSREDARSQTWTQLDKKPDWNNRLWGEYTPSEGLIPAARACTHRHPVQTHTRHCVPACSSEAELCFLSGRPAKTDNNRSDSRSDRTWSMTFVTRRFFFYTAVYTPQALHAAILYIFMSEWWFMFPWGFTGSLDCLIIQKADIKVCFCPGGRANIQTSFAHSLQSCSHYEGASHLSGSLSSHYPLGKPAVDSEKRKHFTGL